MVVQLSLPESQCTGGRCIPILFWAVYGSMSFCTFNASLGVLGVMLASSALRDFVGLSWVFYPNFCVVDGFYTLKFRVIWARFHIHEKHIQWGLAFIEIGHMILPLTLFPVFSISSTMVSYSVVWCRFLITILQLLLSFGVNVWPISTFFRMTSMIALYASLLCTITVS